MAAATHEAAGSRPRPGTGRRLSVWPLIGLAALFSGVALLGNILAGFSLPLTLGATTLLLIVALAVIWRRMSGPARVLMTSVAARGALIALVAVFAYDGSRAVLAQLDPSPFDPFGVWLIFGQLLVGVGAPHDLALAAGIGFHWLNGVSFGLAYAFVFGRAAVRSTRLALLTGVGWGLFLETFQLTLYPGWLNITTYKEFVTISFLGHVIYGLTLGALGHRFLPWPVDQTDAADEADYDEADGADGSALAAAEDE
jgi:hypothetical protein